MNNDETRDELSAHSTPMVGHYIAIGTNDGLREITKIYNS